jgi:transposase
LQQRLTKAQSALAALTPPPGRGRRQFTQEAPLRQAVQAVVTRYRLEGLLSVQIQREVQHRSLRAYRDRPARVEEQPRYVVQVSPDLLAIERFERTLGWRAYATNAPPGDLSLTQGVQAYRDEWLVERNCARLKGRPLSLAPVWLTREDHAIGLTRLLTLAARLLALVEYDVRRQLAETQQTLVGLYPGQATRATAQPTTERLLLAFKEVTLSIRRTGEKVELHITPLSDLQKTILNLMGCPPNLYEQLAFDSS